MKALLAAAGIVALLAVPRAKADVEYRIVNIDSSNNVIGDTGWVICAGAPGTSCSFVGSVGNYSVASDVVTTSNTINPLLDESYSARTSSSNAGTLIIEDMANGYTMNTPSLEVVADGNSTITTSANIVAGYGANTNSICTASTPQSPGSPYSGCTPGSIDNTIASSTFTTPPNSYSFHGFGAGNGAVNPYSLGSSFTITLPSSAGGASGDIQIDAVPEPASVALLGGVLLLAGGSIRRRVRRSA